MKFNFNAIAIGPGGRLFSKILLVMKLTTLIILIAFMQVSAKTYSQITLHVNNKPLTEVLETVKKQTGYVFFYEGHLLDNIIVSLDVNNVPLNVAMDKCLKDLPLSYNVVKKNVVITQANYPVRDNHKAILSIEKTIIGKVTDTTGTPLIGATILNKNSGKTVISDDKGEFTISANEGDVLSISFIGYKTNILKIGEPTGYFNIPMHPNISGLSEVTVSTGYQTLPRERATGSFATLTNKQFNRRVSPTIIDKLENQIPGLLFTTNVTDPYGSATGGFNINIHGHSTLFSNAQPLIVIDNFAYDGNINDINPNDIESVTVLKDAAAASIWGVRSGNGVIVFTTKKGKRNQPLKINFNSNVTIGARPNLFYSHNFLDANDYINIEEKLFNQGFFTNNLNQPSYLASPVVQLLNNEKAGLISSTDATSQIDQLRNNDVRNDLAKYFYQKSINQQYNLNLSGGNDKSDYYFSFGEDNGRSNQVGASNNRITINSTYNFYPIKNLHLYAKINYANSSAEAGNQPALASFFPYTKLVDANGNAQIVPRDFSESYKANMVAKGFLNWEYKPFDELNFADNKTSAIDNTINAGAIYSFLKGLDVNLNYQYQKISSLISNDNSVNTYYSRNLVNQYTQIGTDGTLSYPIPVGGVLNEATSTLNSQQYRLQFDFNHDWNSQHQIAAIAGMELRQAISSTNKTIDYGYDKNTDISIPTIDFFNSYPLNPLGNQHIPNGGTIQRNTNNFVSYFANAAYTFQGKYIFDVSGRIDHSNLFGVNTNQKAVPLYHLGFAWDLTREGFYHVDWLTQIKPRVTFGYTANINTSATAVTTIGLRQPNDYDNSSFAYISNPGNPELQWEKTKNINFGVDFSLKNNLLFGALDYFTKKGINLFGSSQLAPSVGFTTFFGNTANTAGNGFDIDLSSNIINKQNFRWVSRIIISHVIDKVTKYDVKPDVNTLLTASGVGGNGTIVPIVGANEFGIFSYKWAGLSHDAGDPQGYLNNKPSTDYATIINQSTVDSLQYNGSSRPTIFGSFNNTLSYHNFSISFIISYKLGYYFRKSAASSILTGPGQYLNEDILKAWTKPGDELKTIVPSIQYPPFNGLRDYFYSYSSALIDKGDQIRLQDISISYDLERAKMKHLPFSHIQIYAYVNNIGILWRANKDHLDPDVFSTTSFGAYPTPRTYSLGLKCSY